MRASQHTYDMKPRPLLFVFLLAVLASSLATPSYAQEISEFMASNNGTLVDGYGDDAVTQTRRLR